MLANDYFSASQSATILSLEFSAGTLQQHDFSLYVKDSANFPEFDSFRASSANIQQSPQAAKALDQAEDGILIFCLQDGEIQLSDGTLHAHAAKGDTLIADMSYAAEFTTPGFDARCLLVSKAYLKAFGFIQNNLRLHKISGSHAVAKMLNRQVCDLHASAHLLSAAEASALLEPTLALLQAAMNTVESGANSSGVQATNEELQKVRSFIEQNLNQPDLSVDFIADSLGMSRAKLYRLTDPLGGVKRFIRTQRLEQAYSRLKGTASQPLSISGLAFDLGFGSENAFRRCFKESYGISPRAARALDA